MDSWTQGGHQGHQPWMGDTSGTNHCTMPWSLGSSQIAARPQVEQTLGCLHLPARGWDPCLAARSSRVFMVPAWQRVSAVPGTP